MGFFLTIAVAIRALARNKMRAGLTVLGVVIGIAAVTTMVSIGSSAGQLVQHEVQSFGTNFLFVEPGDEVHEGVQQKNMPTLTAADARAMATELDSVLAVSPLVATSSPVVRGNNNWQPRQMMGVGVNYRSVRSWDLRAGTFFSANDVQTGSRVCVIGYTIVKQLFQTMNPIGETLRVGNIPFTVVGVLEKKGAGLTGEDQDDVMLMPYTTVKRRIHGSTFDDVHAIFVAAKSPKLIKTATRDIEQLLRDRHGIAPGEDSDFDVHSSEEVSKFLGTLTGIMTSLLASVAGISLLVGGVGIMNIMLVSVTERTREIGIRMAVGAKGRDILIQFLIESVVLSCFGGAIGMALGIGASVGITTIINEVSPGSEWPIVVSIPAAIVAMIFAAIVGMVFGLYPAWRASRLDPIDALRYE